ALNASATSSHFSTTRLRSGMGTSAVSADAAGPVAEPDDSLCVRGPDRPDPKDAVASRAPSTEPAGSSQGGGPSHGGGASARGVTGATGRVAGSGEPADAGAAAERVAGAERAADANVDEASPRGARDASRCP